MTWRPPQTRGVSEQPHRAALSIDIDVHEGRRLAKPGHPLHLAAERHDKPRPSARNETAHRQDESFRTIPQRRFMRQRKMGLGHADKGRPETEFVEALEVLLSLHLKIDAIGAVQARRNGLNL